MTTEPTGSAAELNWFKSSYSSNESAECVEVAIAWRKSSHSSNESADCVEVATCPDTVHVRDSKDPEGTQLAFGPAEWAAFVSYAAEYI
ncbi:DUF397 domain-containing protein [Actinacidiphila bryophytorum]|uniref:DUF397 domain-containing protein n=1 Tax=Actinacidiphila bryophytorum TaxID=1436133 RepID=A0A9W4H021_9ACTN|nr:DUF397 domain-containing protein [Actinacidiphila bryophytorum]MBM9434611.1 DUF397 domain-containing protein [Actinacidiphila bryophytorum]MBN6543979.1 DUF397 domain-containing protein [Actinacidiphila bryophytorum]CAG7628075.1 conserved hypothetical protein [Actinacidiphila bryophytorum]